jgi:hypothetical protein
MSKTFPRSLEGQSMPHIAVESADDEPESAGHNPDKDSAFHLLLAPFVAVLTAVCGILSLASAGRVRQAHEATLVSTTHVKPTSPALSDTIPSPGPPPSGGEDLEPPLSDSAWLERSEILLSLCPAWEAETMAEYGMNVCMHQSITECARRAVRRRVGRLGSLEIF